RGGGGPAAHRAAAGGPLRGRPAPARGGRIPHLARLAPPPALPTHRPPATARRPGRSAADPYPVARRHGPQRRPAPVAPPPGRLGRADDHGRGHGPRTRGLPRPPVVRRRTHRPIPAAQLRWTRCRLGSGGGEPAGGRVTCRRIRPDMSAANAHRPPATYHARS